MSQLEALGLTLLVEVAVGLAIGLARSPCPAPAWWRLAAIVAACSLVTHPFAWHLNRALVRELSFVERALMIEAAVVVVEALLLRAVVPMSWHRAGLVSLTMNASSFAIGWALQ